MPAYVDRHQGKGVITEVAVIPNFAARLAEGNYVTVGFYDDPFLRAGHACFNLRIALYEGWVGVSLDRIDKFAGPVKLSYVEFQTETRHGMVRKALPEDVAFYNPCFLELVDDEIGSEPEDDVVHLSRIKKPSCWIAELVEASEVRDDLRITVIVKYRALAMAEAGKKHGNNSQPLMESLMRHEASFDITLEMGTDHIKAHRCILSCMSPVFDRMLNGSMQEARTSTVKIDDIDMDTVRAMISSMYRDCVPDDVLGDLVRAGKLLQAFRKYEVCRLVEQLEYLLVTALNVKNAANLLELADRLGATHLRCESLKYIIKDGKTLYLIQESQSFDMLRPCLKEEILAKFAASFVRDKKRKREGKEFPSETDWSKLSAAQLRRACSERELPDDGPVDQLIRILNEYEKTSPKDQ